MDRSFYIPLAVEMTDLMASAVASSERAASIIVLPKYFTAYVSVSASLPSLTVPTLSMSSECCDRSLRLVASAHSSLSSANEMKNHFKKQTTFMKTALITA